MPCSSIAIKKLISPKAVYRFKADKKSHHVSQRKWHVNLKSVWKCRARKSQDNLEKQSGTFTVSHIETYYKFT